MTKRWKRVKTMLNGPTADPRTAAMRRLKMRRFPRALSRWIPFGIPRLRLSHQLLGFFVLVVLVPFLLLSFSIYSINQRAVKKQIANFTEHTAEATYSELNLEMQWQQEQAKLAGQYWTGILANPVAIKQQMQIRRFFAEYPDYQAVAFYDANGRLLEVFRTPQPIGSSASVPASETIPSKKIALSLSDARNPKSAMDMHYALSITLPGHEMDSTGKYGAVVFFKQFPYLERLINERFQTFHSGFVIADRDGVIIAGPPQLVSQKLPQSDLTVYNALKDGMAREYSTDKQNYDLTPVDNKDEQNDPQLEKVFIKMPTLGWGLIFESPYRIQKSFILRARTQSVALVFLCIVLIVILGLLYSRGINRNFRQLIKGIKALAEGRYSRKIRLITKYWTPYEIIYLTAEFNRMATKISTAWTSIQKLNQELVYKNQQDLFIAQATQRLHSSLEIDTVCENAAEILCERSEIQSVLIYLLNDTGQHELTAKSDHKLPRGLQEDHLIHIDTLVARHAAQLVTPINLEQDSIAFLPDYTVATLQPIYYQDAPLGIIVLIKAPKNLQEALMFDDAMVLDLIISQIGVAVHQARQWNQIQQANQQLAKLDELKSNLIDTVSHELRTPLTNIKGYTSRLIRNDASLDPEIKLKSLRVIKQQADRLGRMVEDLLVIPDLERQGGIRVFPDRVNLHELITRCIAFVQEKASQPLNVSEGNEYLDILVDPDRMEQVLLNLLDNAMKYSTDETPIEVNTFQVTETLAEIQVFNQCESIATEDLGTLFTKFKRLDERLTRTTRGTGLGLFITKGLVEAMGGTIRLDGSQGFRVIIQVPLFDAHPANLSEESPDTPASAETASL